MTPILIKAVNINMALGLTFRLLLKPPTGPLRTLLWMMMMMMMMMKMKKWIAMSQMMMMTTTPRAIL